MKSSTRISLVLLGWTLVSFALAGEKGPFTVHSPDQRITLVWTVNAGERADELAYRVDYKEKAVLGWSTLGFRLQNQPPMGSSFTCIAATRSSVHDAYRMPWGERSTIPNVYNSLTLQMQENKPPTRRLTVQCRVFNEGLAFRYEWPEQTQVQDFVIEEERTQFRFSGACQAWEEYGHEGEYRKVLIGAIREKCEIPLTIEAAPDLWLCLNEAGSLDYSRMLLRPVANADQALQTQLWSPVKAVAPFVTPWRVLMIGERPGDLLLHNYLLYNLSEPCAMADTKWIRPGKAIREITLTTEGGLACVDFAVTHGLQYVEYDAGWYGLGYKEEHNPASDATQVVQNIDLKKVIDYAHAHNIGILVYVNKSPLYRQLDQILPLYRSWGIDGLKFGFVDGRTQEGIRFITQAVAKSAQYGFIVDIHDDYRPTGLSRTWPNLLTVEGIRGNEHMPSAEHNCTLPFTRFVSGAGDYTYCYYTPRLKNTRAHQLAASVVFFSPLQFLFWYDKPEYDRGEPELTFWQSLPTSWDSTVVLHDRIGDYVTIARRHGEDWYVGSIADTLSRTLDIPLDFLHDGRRYQATVFTDAESGRVNIEQREVAKEMVLRADLRPSGGQAIRLVPKP